MANNQIAKLLQTATRDIIAHTQNFIQSVSDKPLGEDTVSIKMNGEEMVLNREDYNEMKAQHREMKDAVKTQCKEIIKPKKD